MRNISYKFMVTVTSPLEFEEEIVDRLSRNIEAAIKTKMSENLIIQVNPIME